MKLFKTTSGWIVDDGRGLFRLPADAASGLLLRDDLHAYLTRLAPTLTPAEPAALEALGAPIDEQEVWAAGVTYYRSRTARMEESKVAAGGSFYDLVYNAERPEIFFKSAAWRVVPPGGQVRIRKDATWNVPEPELALVVSPKGRIIGYTAGNDMSSRDIEGENPLYLPQAKIYDGSCAIGPAILVAEGPIPASTGIALAITRNGARAFQGSTTVSAMKRELQGLVDYLYRETSFPNGAILLTGTGTVPPDDFTLQHGDQVAITIDGIGTLQNVVA